LTKKPCGIARFFYLLSVAQQSCMLPSCRWFSESERGAFFMRKMIFIILLSTVLQAGEARPGLALTLKVEGDVAKITIAFDYLQAETAVPKNIGVRQYTYDVPLTGAVTQVGWNKGKDVSKVVLQGKVFTYMPRDADRFENGAIRVTKGGTPESFRVQGVYYYMNQLFIIDDSVVPGVSLLLYEQPEK